MKVLLVNGSPREKGCTYTALKEAEKTLENNGIAAELFWVGNKPVAGCIACGRCKSEGKCVFSDGVNEIAARLKEFDGVIVGSPVYYAGPSGQICCFLDRLFHSTRQKDWQGKFGGAIVSCRRGGASAAFDRLNKYFTICRIPVASSVYWNQVHGSTPEEVLKDEEGMQTVRELANNMAWLIKSKYLAEKEGVTLPDAEPRKITNFIR